jgi:hypothetical protein
MAIMPDQLDFLFNEFLLKKRGGIIIYYQIFEEVKDNKKKSPKNYSSWRNILYRLFGRILLNKKSNWSELINVYKSKSCGY